MYLIGGRGVWTNRKDIEQNFEHEQISTDCPMVVMLH